MKVIFPGSFDPVTRGHLDIILRAAHLFDEVVVGVLVNQQKKQLFTPGERIEMLDELLYDTNNVTVKAFSGLLVDFVQAEKADAVIRGIRSALDYDYERQISLLNRSLYAGMEELFLLTDAKYMHVSSSFAREVASYGGDVFGLVTENVAGRLLAKYENNRKDR